MPAARIPYRGGARRFLSNRICLACGQVFRPRTRDQRSCCFDCGRVVTGWANAGRFVKVKPTCFVCGKPTAKQSKRYCSSTCYRTTLVGRKHTDDAKERMSKIQQAIWEPKRQPGKRAERKRIRMSREWAEWRTSVFKRDDYTCQWCGRRGGKLHPHHIQKFADYHELRFDVNNGMTLCIECHKTTENYGNRKQAATHQALATGRKPKGKK